MGLKLAWVQTGTATFRTHGHPGGDGGEGDSSGGPIPQRASTGAWPTLVIEAAVSETLSELRGDMRWWFRASGHQVKIVLLARLAQPERTITLEKWVEVHEPRPGVTTRAAAQVQPRLQQTITITRATASTNPASYTVHRGALRLEFNLLFLRQPRAGEADVVLDTRSLQEYAAKVWTSGE